MHRYLASKLSALIVRLSDISEDLGAPYSPSSVAALLTLLHRPSLAVTELASILRLTQPSTTRLVDKLVRSGLVIRLAGSGKVTPITLTPSGEAAARGLQDRRLAAFARAIAILDEGERRALDGIVSKMLGEGVDNRRLARQICRFCDHAVCDGELCPVGSAATTAEKTGIPSC